MDEDIFMHAFYVWFSLITFLFSPSPLLAFPFILKNSISSLKSFIFKIWILHIEKIIFVSQNQAYFTYHSDI